MTILEGPFSPSKRPHRSSHSRRLHLNFHLSPDQPSLDHHRQCRSRDFHSRTRTIFETDVGLSFSRHLNASRALECHASIFYISTPISGPTRLTFTHFAIAVTVDQCARTCHEFNCAVGSKLRIVPLQIQWFEDRPLQSDQRPLRVQPIDRLRNSKRSMSCMA